MDGVGLDLVGGRGLGEGLGEGDFDGDQDGLGFVRATPGVDADAGGGLEVADANEGVGFACFGFYGPGAGEGWWHGDGQVEGWWLGEG